MARDINELDKLIGDHTELTHKLIQLSRNRLAARPGYHRSLMAYLHLDCFYVEEGKVIVDFSYSEPYSGSEVLEFTAEEVDF